MQENLKSLRDNTVQINYTSHGEGETTLLFIHGWCINHTYWEHQTQFFKKDFQVVTIDLPGFGNSTAQRENWTIEEYAKDIIAFINEMNFRKVILIGHSMSAYIILEAVIQNNHAISGIIGIDNYKLVDVEFSKEQLAQYETLFDKLGSDFKNTAMLFADQMLFHPSTTINDKDRVKNDILHSDHQIAFNALSNYVQYEAGLAQKLENLEYPLFLLNSDAIPTNIAGLENRCQSGFELSEIHATGHYPMIEKSNEFNLLLNKIIQKISLSTHNQASARMN